MKRLLLLSALLALSGHAAAQRVNKSVDSFDGATRVEVDGYYGMDCGFTMLCGSLGAIWLSTRPDDVTLRVQVVNTLVGIEGAKLNIDGQIITLEPVPRLTDFETRGRYIRNSMRDFHIPVELLRKMVAGASVKMRIETGSGLLDATFSGGRKVTGAHKALADFVAALPLPGASNQAQAAPIPANGSTPPGQANSWWNQQHPAPAPTRYRCTDADGKPYVTTTPTSGCVVE